MKNATLILFSAGMLSIAAACSASSSTVEVSENIITDSPAPVSAAAVEAYSSPVHVVELFTSQGCSSCPPANRFVSQIANNDGVLALTYGVTYWDYLGWEDTFGDPKFTQRQREYRRPLKAQNIYTPQIILNGAKHNSRYGVKDVEAATLSASAGLSKITLKDGTLNVTGDVPRGATLALVSYRPGTHEVDVKRGENGGRKLTLTNVVTDVVKMPWTGEGLTTEIKPETGLAYAALFHAAGGSQIISASTFMLNDVSE